MGMYEDFIWEQQQIENAVFEREIDEQHEANLMAWQEKKGLRRIGLVSCSKSKATQACQAQELYQPSDLFRKASKYARVNYDVWFVLSAKHGLLSPETVIEPYDETLINMSVYARRQWAQRVFDQIKTTIPAPAHIFFHAGSAYRKDLTALLEKSDYIISSPLAKMGIGQAKQFYLGV